MKGSLTFEELHATEKVAESFVKQIAQFDDETLKAMKLFFAGMDFQKTISQVTN